jgi:methionine aminopeptidase
MYEQIQVLHWPDDWTATTGDGGRTCQFEHTLLMTETGKKPCCTILFIVTSAWVLMSMTMRN